MHSSQERLARFEKDNRFLFLSGCFFVLLVVSFWIVVVLNAENFLRLVAQPGAQEEQLASRLKATISSPTSRERILMEYCNTLISGTFLMTRVLAVNFIVFFLFALGFLQIGFSRYQRRLLALAKELGGFK